MKSRKGKGFSLIELIIVVAIIGLLAAALFVAVDPAGRIGAARDARRYSDVSAILNAILQYTVDANALPSAVSGLTADTYYVIEKGSGGGSITCNEAGTATGIPLGTSLVDKYLGTVPTDPRISDTGTSSTQYYIKRSSNNRITVGACEHYQSGSLEVQR